MIFIVRAAQAQPTLLYQWNFDGAAPAAPTVSAGGGTLGITNSANGSIGFSNTGGVGGGGMLDLSHNQQWGTLDPTGYASSDAMGNALTGLGAMNHITVSMWVKANGAGNALTAGTLPRLLELADIPNYDQSNNNPPPQTSQANNGLTMRLSSSKNFELYTRGQSNSTSVLGNALPADQWTLVVWTLDTAFTGSNNNPYYDPDMQAVNGGQFAGNQTLYNATETSVPRGFDGSATDDLFNPDVSPTHAYPGTINFGSSAQIYFGNRGIGTPANPAPGSGDAGGMTQGFNGFIDNVRIYNGLVGPTQVEQIRRSDLGLPAHFTSQWTSAGNGDWLDGTKWSPGVPFITDDAATFGAQAGAGPHVITLSTTVRIGTLTFGDASNPSGNYTIGGSGVIILSNTDGGSLATVSVLSGNHTINAQINAGTFNVPPSPSAVFDIASGASLTVTNFVTFNAGAVNGMAKRGAGRLVLTPPATFYGNLRVEGGTLQLAPRPSPGGNTNPYSLFVGNGATLDVSNSSVVDRNTTDLAVQRARIAAGYAGGSWTGTSTTTGVITSSSAAATAGSAHPMAVGYAAANTILTWVGGGNPGGSSVLISYTLAGDSDLNGSVNSDDFTAMSQSFNATNATWVQGDFNYDGTVNALDFNAIATNYGAPLTSPALATLVPEPLSLALLLPALVPWRRRKSNRT